MDYAWALVIQFSKMTTRIFTQISSSLTQYSAEFLPIFKEHPLRLGERRSWFIAPSFGPLTPMDLFHINRSNVTRLAGSLPTHEPVLPVQDSFPLIVEYAVLLIIFCF